MTANNIAASSSAATEGNQAPLRTAIEISSNIVAHALASFANYNAHTAKFVTVAQDGLTQLDGYYQPHASKLNNALFAVDEKLAPIVNNINHNGKRMYANGKEVVDVRITPLVVKARAEQQRLVSYTTEAVHNANQTARATIETQTARTQEALVQLLATLRTYAAELEARTPYSADLRKRITALILAAVDLSQQTRAYIATSAESSRNGLHQSLDFVATEIESRLVKGEVTTVEVPNLVERVRALLTAATEAVAVVTVQGVRNVSSFVAIKNTEQVAKEAADIQAPELVAADTKTTKKEKKNAKTHR